jgi:hypothetical protein
MADYLLMVLEDERAHEARSPGQIAELIDDQARFGQRLRDAGQLRDSARLRPSKHGKRVKRVAAELQVVDGPFADDGKALGACYWVDAANIDDAARLAAELPALASDEVDVRPLMKGRASADKHASPGKVFACGVLGNAASEAEWTRVMDAIDATSDEVRADSIAGVRLQPPTSGKRVATRGERRAILDAPFLESKEVIGGVFYLRAMTIEDAVRWAAATRFIAFGGVELRELWRS